MLRVCKSTDDARNGVGDSSLIPSASEPCRSPLDFSFRELLILMDIINSLRMIHFHFVSAEMLLRMLSLSNEMSAIKFP